MLLTKEIRSTPTGR